MSKLETYILGVATGVAICGITQVVDNCKSGKYSNSETAQFPVTQDSLDKINYDFGNSRSGGKRCHAGIDIFTKGRGKVVAMEDGIVLNKYFFTRCGGNITEALLIYHPNIDGGITINYGELDSGSIKVYTSDKVKKEQHLGNATNCGMLHLEVYEGKVNQNKRWYSSKRKPRNLLNPNKLLRKSYHRQRK